jgi:hypothetical protein
MVFNQVEHLIKMANYFLIKYNMVYYLMYLFPIYSSTYLFN